MRINRLKKLWKCLTVDGEVFRLGGSVDCRLLQCLVVQEVTTGWWYEDTVVEWMVERWRADRLLNEVENGKWYLEAASPTMIFQELFYKG